MKSLVVAYQTCAVLLCAIDPWIEMYLGREGWDTPKRGPSVVQAVSTPIRAKINSMFSIVRYLENEIPVKFTHFCTAQNVLAPNCYRTEKRMLYLPDPLLGHKYCPPDREAYGHEPPKQCQIVANKCTAKGATNFHRHL